MNHIMVCNDSHISPQPGPAASATNVGASSRSPSKTVAPRAAGSTVRQRYTREGKPLPLHKTQTFSLPIHVKVSHWREKGGNERVPNFSNLFEKNLFSAATF